MSNRTIMQFFEWYLPEDGQHWKRTAENAKYLAELGITDVWLPPAYKGAEGMRDVGYGVYDLYDLGEFDQKGTIPTKYGTKDEYLAAIDALHAQGIKVLADIVLNHRTGADRMEVVSCTKYAVENRKVPLKENKVIDAWTYFNFPGRNGKYSDFCWNEEYITAVNYDHRTRLKDKYVYLLHGHDFDPKVSGEKGNYDYLMGCDVDFSHPDVQAEMLRWGKWYVDMTQIDGFRLDALKHIRYDFYPQWLQAMREHTGKEMFAVGEYWVQSADFLVQQLRNHKWTMTMFDVPLHHRFYCLSNNKLYEHKPNEYEKVFLRTIMDRTLVSRTSEYAVTFVDNHDTLPDQALRSWVADWFKPLAYALILLWDRGTPCVFYGDLYGVPHHNYMPVTELPALLKARKKYAYGRATPEFGINDVIGWTREGNLAVVMSVSGEGWKDMPLGKPGDVYVDCLGKRGEEVVIGPDGKGHFTCAPRSVSVWVPKE